jgi:hypothetical protein
MACINVHGKIFWNMCVYVLVSCRISDLHFLQIILKILVIFIQTKQLYNVASSRFMKKLAALSFTFVVLYALYSFRKMS